MRDRDLLIEESLAFVQRVVAAKPVRIETSTPIGPAESVIKPNLPKPKDRLFEREDTRQRVADRAGPGCLNRLSASISGALPGLGCQAERQRVEVGLIRRAAVKARMWAPAIIEVQVAAD